MVRVLIPVITIMFDCILQAFGGTAMAEDFAAFMSRFEEQRNTVEEASRAVAQINVHVKALETLKNGHLKRRQVLQLLIELVARKTAA